MDRNAYGRLRRVCRRVALRKESVDRNRKNSRKRGSSSRSLSARRAWIEIRTETGSGRAVRVALRKESVDRNDNVAQTVTAVIRRSPQGERG